MPARLGPIGRAPACGAWHTAQWSAKTFFPATCIAWSMSKGGVVWARADPAVSPTAKAAASGTRRFIARLLKTMAADPGARRAGRDYDVGIAPASRRGTARPATMRARGAGGRIAG